MSGGLAGEHGFFKTLYKEASSMSGNQKAFEVAMNAGHSAAWDQNWAEAVQYYGAAIEQFPDNAMALTSLGLVLFEMQDFEKALKCYQRAVQFTPEDPMPVEKIARIFERLGRLPEAVRTCIDAAELHLKMRNAEKAIENWNRAISLQPENITVRARLAMVYERMGRKGDAVTEYVSTASLLQRLGQRAKAIQVAEYALKLMPESDEARQTLNMLNNNQNLPSPARPRGGTGPMRMAEVRQLDKVERDGSTLDPIAEAEKKALVEMAGLLFDQAEDAGPAVDVNRKNISVLARGASETLENQADRTRILLHLGQAIESQTQGQEKQAAEELGRAIALGLNAPAALFDLGLLQAKNSDPNALRALQKSVKHPDYAFASYLVIAQVYERTGDLSSAATAYLQAMRLADAETVPEDQADDLLQLYEPIIESQTSQKDIDSLARLCSNLSNQIVRPDWRNYLKTARQQMPPPSEGSSPLPLAEMLLESNSSQVVDALARIRVYMDQNCYHAAMDEAFYSLEFAPTYLPLHVQIGDILLKEEKFQEAADKFITVAELYSLRGEAAQAIRLLKRVIAVAPMEIKIRNHLIDLLVAQGQIEDALGQYCDLANLYLQLAELKLARQTYATALRLTQQSKTHRAWSVKILYKIADIDMQVLDWRQAVRIYEQIRTLEPDDVNARTTLVDLNLRLGHDANAYTEMDAFTAQFEQSGRRAEAILAVEKIIEEHPDKLDLLKRLADLYVRNGQTQEAVDVLDKLADTLLSSGNKDGAIAMLRAIIALKPANLHEYQQVLLSLKGV
jgi:tetratricopeptide (TPR) repeat protein